MIIVVAAILGLLVGSFINVLVLRLHAGSSFVRGRSICPSCKHQLAWYDNIPVLSWMLLRARCRYCKKPISPQYPLVELVTAALFALAATHTPHGALEWVSLGLWAYVIGSLVALSVYDLRWSLLPDRILLPLLLPALGLLAAAYLRTQAFSVVYLPLAAAVVFGGAFYAIAAVSKGRWMGGGDIKLAFIMGLLLGLQQTSLAMFIAFDAAAIVGVVLIVLGRKSRSDSIPFGPFLIAGTLVAYLWGTPIIDWYLRWSGLNLL